MRRQFLFLFIVLAMAMSTSPAMAQANPCNPCGPKAKNPCNPCGGKKTMPKLVPVNPCHAKHGTVFYVADPMGRNQVTFTSEAPLEDIVGTTNEIVGYVVFDPDKPRKGVRGFFKVALKGLDTGIPLRNEHLQSNMWLNAEDYPDITFTIESARDIRQTKSSQDYQTYRVRGFGSFTLHGQTKQVAIPARMTYLRESEKTRMKLPGNLLGIRVQFELTLADFGVTGPPGKDLIGSRVGETVNIEVSVFASDKKPPAANPCNPCNPCGPKGKNPCNPCGGKKGSGGS